MSCTYSQQLLSEYFATLTLILVGNSCIANELLPATKGHSMGFGFVALAFGIAVAFTISIFGNCSSHTNPAGLLAEIIMGLGFDN
jgi:glycerol uptake facilitator-like aquaporin